MKKILVTGGSGFIGTNLIDSLVKDGFLILNLDNNKPLKDVHNQYFKEVDLLNFDKLKKSIIDFSPEILIHLAAITDLNGEDLDYYAANIKGTQNIIDIAQLVPSLKKIIYTSSMYVCRPGFIPPDYDTYNPHTVYGESKAKMELLIKDIKNAHYEWIIIRPTSIWGPWFNIPYIDFFNVVYQKKYFDFGKACTKTYGYIGNTVFQIKKLIDTPGLNGKTYYLGDMPPIQISEWANEISIAFGKGKIKSIPYLLLKGVALAGDVLKKIGIKFPMTSFRLSNMTTDNILPLENLYVIAGEPPHSRKEGVAKTINWLVEDRNYIVEKRSQPTATPNFHP